MSIKGSKPVAPDVGAAGGIMTATDCAVRPQGRQQLFDAMHDSSQRPDLTKDSFTKNFSYITSKCYLKFDLNAKHRIFIVDSLGWFI